MTALREVRLYGWLGEKYGRTFHLAASSPAQAVRLLCANFPGFERDFVGGENWQHTYYKVWSGADRITSGEDAAREGTQIIRIVPVAQGSGGLGQVILGGILVVVGFAISLGTAGWAAPVGQAMMAAGFAMMVGGVIQMLTPVKKAKKEKNNAFDGPINMAAAGSCVPLAIGECFCGSAVISASIHLDQLDSDNQAAEDTVVNETIDGVPTRTSSSGRGWAFVAQQSVQTSTGLTSKAYARFIDLISEGPIRGLVDDMKSVYFDDVPVQNADGTLNFEDVVLALRYGTQDQPHFTGFDSVENEIAVGVTVEQATPVVRSVNNPEVESVVVRLRWPAFLHINKDGKRRGTSCPIEIWVQSNGGGYELRVEDLVAGKSTSVYEKAYRIELKGEAPWDIRVVRLNDDPDGIKTINAFSWESFTEVINERLRYPMSAMAAVSLDSEQFSSVPTRLYKVKGISDFWIPSNYNPDTRVYTGLWDGTFARNWTNNPAWVVYGFLRNRRWGIGKFVSESAVEALKADLYVIGKYCDQLVPDGMGGMEPRFTCNVWKSDKQEAWEFIDDLVSVFRGMHYWSAGSVSASCDAPGEPVFRFNQTNVIDGRFVYEGASLRTAFSVVVAYYQDPDNFGRRRPVRVQDDDLVVSRGIVIKEVEAIACTSRAQAIRFARAILAAAKFESRVVRFQPLEGAFVRPGNIIEIADPKKAGIRLGGRILKSTTTSVTVDAPVTIAPGVTYTLTVVERQDQPIIKTLTNAPGVASVLTWDEAMPAPPAPMSIWLLGSDEIQPQQFRVVGVAEVEPWRYTVQAMAYAPQKYDYIDNGGTIEDGPVTSVDQPPPRPTGLTGGEALYTVGSTQMMQADFSWRPSMSAKRYVGTLQSGADDPIEFDVQNTSVSFTNVEPDDYMLTVRAVGANGKMSRPAYLAITLDGVADPPPPLDALSLDVPSEDSPIGTLYWEAPTQMSVRSGGAVEIRFWPGTIATASWSGAQPLGEVPGADSRFGVTLADGTYLAKTRAFDGQLSTDAAGVQYGSPAPGGGTLSITASPARVSKYGIGGSQQSSTIFFSVQGGTGPFTFSSVVYSGAAAVISDPTGMSTKVGVTGMAVDEFRSGVLRCTVTDSLGATGHVDVPYEFYRYDSTACVILGAEILGFGRAALACSGHELETADEITLAPGIAAITHASDAWRRCSRITAGEFRLDCSNGAGIPTRWHGLVAACQLTPEHEIAVRRDSDTPTWAAVTSVEPIGFRMVRKLSLGEQCFWAGNRKGLFVLHHNIKP